MIDRANIAMRQLVRELARLTELVAKVAHRRKQEVEQASMNRRGQQHNGNRGE